jgi:hypothetical protein
MTAKTRIGDFLGEKALVPPSVLAVIFANERRKYVLSLLQMAVSNTDGLHGAAAPSPQSEPASSGISDVGFDDTVAGSASDRHGDPRARSWSRGGCIAVFALPKRQDSASLDCLR